VLQARPAHSQSLAIAHNRCRRKPDVPRQRRTPFETSAAEMLADVTDGDELLKRHRDSQRLKHGWIASFRVA
jgi:hypothetical protein